MTMLQNGADGNCANNDLYTPLHMASKEGHQKVVEILLDNKADKSLQTKVSFSEIIRFIWIEPIVLFIYTQLV